MQEFRCQNGDEYMWMLSEILERIFYIKNFIFIHIFGYSFTPLHIFLQTEEL